MQKIITNTNKRYNEIKKAFFTDGEIKHFEQIMKNPKEQKTHDKLLNKKPSLLYAKAMSLITRVELGEFNEEQMEIVEKYIAHYLSAIEDMQKVLEMSL